MDRKSPLHFNLDVLQPLPSSCVRPDGTRWSAPRYSAPLWDPGSVKMHCGRVMISNYVDAEAIGRWSSRGECEEWCVSGGGLSLQNKAWSLEELPCPYRIAPQGWEKSYCEGWCASVWEGLDRWDKSGICSCCLWRISVKSLLSTLSSSFNFNFCFV